MAKWIQADNVRQVMTGIVNWGGEILNKASRTRLQNDSVKLKRILRDTVPHQENPFTDHADF